MAAVRYAILASAVVLLLLPLGQAIAQPAGEVVFHGGIDIAGGKDSYGRSNLFFRGDTVKFYGWSNAYRQWASGLIQTPGSVFDVEVIGPSGVVALRESYVADEQGRVQFSLPVTGDLKFGKYDIRFEISKEGYEPYVQDTHGYGFYVSPSEDEIVRVQGYSLKIQPVEQTLNFGSYPTFKAKMCPPLPPSEWDFADPAGTVAYAPANILGIKVTRPDGTQIYRAGAINSNSCEAGQEIGGDQFDQSGKWSVRVAARWIENETMYEVESEPAWVVIGATLFRSDDVEHIDAAGNFPATEPLDWSRDGQKVLFKYDYTRLAIMGPDGSNATALGIDLKGEDFDYLGQGRFSPDGGRVYYTWAGDLYRYDLQGKSSTRLTGTGSVYSFDVMPDDRLMYASGGELWIADSDGKNREKVLGGDADLYGFDVSYDGKKLLYARTTGSGYVWSNRVLEVYDIGTGQTQTVPNIDIDCGEPARWAPSDQLIIYHVQGCGKGWPGGFISVTGLDGYPEFLVLAGNENPRHFVVSPDGSKLMFSLDYTSGDDGKVFGGKSDFYSMTFAKTVPEFPLASLAGALALAGVVGWLRLRD